MARTHVVMADEVLEAIDERVGERGRSRFLEEAAREKLMRIELEEALRSTKTLPKSSEACTHVNAGPRSACSIGWSSS